MKTLKTATIVVTILLFIISVGLLALGNMVALIAIGTGILMGYYLLLLLVISVFSNKDLPKYAKAIIGSLFFAPIIIMLINPEGLFNFLLSGIHLDMK